jgi:TetR/AcrR family transcriptional repressor of mexCD-oprJ operon
MPDSTSTASARQPQRRADAQRNIDRILDAGLRIYGQQTGVSMAAIAKAAGVGRVTLYGHFDSRTALAKALVRRAIDETVAGMDGLDLEDGPADVAFDELVLTQWHMLLRNRNLRANVIGDVTAQWLRDQHDPIMERVERLLARGQEEGAFRTDLPRTWMIASLYSLVHAASDEVAAGRTDDRQAAGLLLASLRSMFRPQ